MTNIQFQPPNTIQFEVKLENSGQLHLNMLVPGDEQSANMVAHALSQTQPLGPGWDAEYRQLTGQPDAAAPHWRKLRGTLQGSTLTLSERSTSSDGENWQPYPEADPNMLAPASPVTDSPAIDGPAVSGEVIDRYATLHWREGRIDIEPEPDSDLLELLERVVQLFNGDTPAEWKTRHEQFGGDPRVVPDGKRTGFEVRRAPPVSPASEVPFMRLGDLEFWPLTPLEYSVGGKKWERYPVSDQGGPLPLEGQIQEGPQGEQAQALLEPETEAADPFEMLSQMFDIQSVPVTVQAGGQLDWNEADIPEQHREALRASLLAATGAGNAENWAAQVGDLNPGGPTPQAVRLQVMKALLDAAPGMLDQSYAPVAFTTDGTTWQDIRPQFDEDEEETVSGE